MQLANRLDVVIIAQDEEEMLPFSLLALEKALPCLHSVLVIDGGSKDATLDVCRRFQKTLPLEILERPFDNPPSQFNYGLERCHAEYIMTLGADMVLPGQTLAELFAIRYWRASPAWNLPLAFSSYSLKHVNARCDWLGPSLRLFKNLGCRYRGTVHERLCFANGEPVPREAVRATPQCFVLEISQLKSDAAWLNRYLRYRRFAADSAREGLGIEGMLSDTLRILRDREAGLKPLPEPMIALLDPRLFALHPPWTVRPRFTAPQLDSIERGEFAWT